MGPRVGDHDRGAYLTWLAWYTGVFEPALNAKFLKIQHIYGPFGWAPFDDVLAYFSAAIAKNQYVLGDRFSAADIIIGGSLPFLMGRMIPETDELKSYVTRITERPAYGRARAKDSA